MDRFFYYLVVSLAIALVAFGVFYIAVAAYRFVRGNSPQNLSYSKSLVLARFLSGVSNLLIGATLYWHVNESTASIILVSLTMSAFVLWEWFVRTYFIDPTDS